MGIILLFPIVSFIVIDALAGNVPSRGMRHNPLDQWTDTGEFDTKFQDH